ncbi:MAG TPA: hypothetical protein VFX70_21815 [Mycobacteriales bacterium]|nr:hypothetical protein [Mycobacteriales bacterium]
MRGWPPHVLPVGSLPALDLPAARGGVVAGREPGGSPVTLRLFRATPVRIGVFGAGYFVNLLAFRAFAQGAQVAVVTARPARWAPLVRSAPPGPAWVTVVPPASPTPPAGTMLRPSLLVEDVDAGQGGPRHDLGAWQAGLTLEPAITDTAGRAGTAMRSCDLAVLTRPGAHALRPVQDAFRLPAEELRWLPQMPDDVLAVAVPGRCRFVRLVPTQVERATFGPPPAPTGAGA